MDKLQEIMQRVIRSQEPLADHVNPLTYVEDANWLIDQLEQSQWQPIDTIPQDGTSILVLDEDGHVYDARYVTDWDGSKVWRYPFHNQHGCGCCGEGYGKPIKWMRIPKTEG